MGKMTHLKNHEINIVLDALCNSEIYYINESFTLKNHLTDCKCGTLKKSINDSISYCESMESQAKKLRFEISEELGISTKISPMDMENLEKAI